MFAVNEVQAALIQAAFFERGERAAVEQLRTFFPGLADNENTVLCARSIASWRQSEAEGQ
jgi:hypothetical protein